MTSKQKRSREPRRTVVVRSVDSIDLALWRDAWRLDPDRLAWVEETAHKKWKNGNYTVTLSLSTEKYAALTAGGSAGPNVADVLAETLTTEAWRIIEDDFMRGEVDDIPALTPKSVFLAPTLVVEWPISEAYGIMTAVGSSHGLLGAIELTRMSAASAATVTLAVSMPLEVFDDAVAKFADDSYATPLSECVRAAIADLADAEEKARPHVPSSLDDDIPF